MSRHEEDRYIPEIVRHLPPVDPSFRQLVVSPDPEDQNRMLALASTTRSLTNLAGQWIEQRPDESFFEASVSLEYGERWLKKRSIEARIRVHRR